MILPVGIKIDLMCSFALFYDTLIDIVGTISKSSDFGFS